MRTLADHLAQHAVPVVESLDYGVFVQSARRLLPLRPVQGSQDGREIRLSQIEIFLRWS